MTGLDKWYGYMKSHDRAALWDLLHPDAVFESPVVHTPQRGRDITFKYLSSAWSRISRSSLIEGAVLGRAAQCRSAVRPSGVSV